jgi:3-oxoacyl-[acyl-carrier protein] reductase
MSDRSLEGKVTVVTGAGRGIGQAIAVAYARAGASVVAAARSPDQLEETVARITGEHGRCVAVPTDVTNYAAASTLMERAVSEYGGVDVVVAAAGVAGENKRVDESDPVRWTEAIEVNLFGAFNTAKAAIPHLRRRGGGKIVLIGSGMGHRSGPTRSAYAASKAGVWMLTRVLAEELAGDDICVNELIPGPVLTALIAGREGNLGAGTQGVEWYKQPEDVAPLALFLATQPARGPTGQTFSLARREL